MAWSSETQLPPVTFTIHIVANAGPTFHSAYISRSPLHVAISLNYLPHTTHITLQDGRRRPQECRSAYPNTSNFRPTARGAAVRNLYTPLWLPHHSQESSTSSLNPRCGRLQSHRIRRCRHCRRVSARAGHRGDFLPPQPPHRHGRTNRLDRLPNGMRPLSTHHLAGELGRQ